MGEMIQFDEHMFQMGWFNQQLDYLYLFWEILFLKGGVIIWISGFTRKRPEEVQEIPHPKKCLERGGWWSLNSRIQIHSFPTWIFLRCGGIGSGHPGGPKRWCPWCDETCWFLATWLCDMVACSFFFETPGWIRSCEMMMRAGSLEEEDDDDDPDDDFQTALNNISW